MKPPVSQNPLPSPQILQDSRQKQPQIIDFSKIGEVNFPKTLPVYQPEYFPNFSKQESQSVATTLGITVEPFLVEENTIEGTQFNWQQQNTNLTLSRYWLRYTDTTASPQQQLNEQELESGARSFINKIPVSDKNLTANSKKVVYLKKTESLPIAVKSFADADLVDFFFDNKLENIPLLDNNPRSSIASIRLEKNGHVQSLNLHLAKGFTKGNQYKLKPLENAIQEVKNKKGKVVQSVVLDDAGQALELFRTQPVDVSDTTVTSVQLAYLLPYNNQDLIQPIYVFVAEFTKNNQNGRLYIYLPAIDITAKP